MIRKTNLIILLLIITFIQPSLLGLSSSIYLSLQVIFILSLFLLEPSVSLWTLFFTGLVSDFLLFRPIGFSILVLIFTVSIFKALNSFIGVESTLFRTFAASASLLFGLLFEFILLKMVNNSDIEIMLFIKIFLFNLLAFFFFSIFLLVIKPLILKNA